MSSKGDNEQQMTIEKVRSNYPGITVEDRSTGLKSNTVSSTTTTTTAPSISTRTLNQSSSVSSTDDRSPETTHVQVKPAPEKRNIPPYINFQMSKVLKQNPKSPVVEKPAIAPRKKPEVFSADSGVQSTSKKPVGKPSITLTQISNSSSDKTMTSYLACGDISNPDSPDIQDQLKQFSKDFREKSIQFKSITVTKKDPPSTPRILNSPKPVTGPSLIPKPVESTKVVPNAEIFKFIPKSVNVPQICKSVDRNVSSKQSCLSRIQGGSKPAPTVINASELSKTVFCKTSPIADSSVIVSSKQPLPTANAKGPADNLVKQKKLQSSSSRVIKPATAISVANISSAALASQEMIPAIIKNSPSANITFLLSSLSESGDSKELLEVINSGTNVNVTQSVTLSKSGGVSTLVVPVVAPQSLLNQKSKVGSSSEITQKVNVSNSTPISKNFRKNGNVTSDVSEEAILSNSSSDVGGIGKHDSSSYLISSDETENAEETNSPKQNQVEEPECLTISSDDEAEETLSDKNGIPFSFLTEEPPVAKRNEKLSIEIDDSSSVDAENSLDVTNGEGYVVLPCRTIRIGSFKKPPRSPVVLSKHGLRIVISGPENIVLKIPFREIYKVLIDFGRGAKSVPVIFFYVKPETGKKVGNILRSHYPEDIHLSSDVNQRQITVLPENMSDANRDGICEIFEGTGIMRELSHVESNEILVRSAPIEVQRVMKHPHPVQQVSDPVQTIMVFPPPPQKGGISINTEDYACLAPDVFLNDVIIDFYLKYLYLNHLTAEDREKTHIFSSFFYKRLTDKATPMPRHLKSAGSTTPHAEIRHSRVKNWTKNIDIFSKDYIVIPLNENQHWFLAIICFPGLKGPVRFADNTPIEVSPKEKQVTSTTEISLAAAEQSGNFTSVTITPIKLETRERTRICFDDENDLEDRDEAEATDEEVPSEEDTDEEYLPTETEEKPKPRGKTEREPIKQPCILIFDSLRGAPRNRIIATLRDYLRVEYKVKHGEDRDFSKKVVKGAIPHVPQQDNFTDCGLFVLQYVEAFFDNKITDYHLPINTLRNWFPSEEVAGKRYAIQKLLLQLMSAQEIDIDSLNLPRLNMVSSDEEEDDDDEDDFYPSDDEECDQYLVGLQNFSRYNEEFCGEDEDEDEDPDMMGEGRFAAYDSEDELVSDEEISSDDDGRLYKGLDDVDVETMRTYHRNLHRSGNCIEEVEEDEEMNIEEEEEEIANEEDEEEHELSSDIQEELNRSNINQKSVSITVTNRTVSPAGSSSIGAPQSSSSKVETDIAKLKAARTWAATRDQSNDDCSIPKKFKHN